MKNVLLVVLTMIIVSPSMAKKVKKQKSLDELVSINMHRGTCFGRCPDYAIEIHRSGTLIFTGYRFIDDTGVYLNFINKQVANKLLDEFVKYRIDTCRDLYENQIPDLPQIYYTLKYKKHTQKIYCANWGPKYLTTMAEKMDIIGKKTDSVGWKRVGGVPRGQGN